MNYDALAKRARYFKQDEKGAGAMSEIMENMMRESEQNKAKNSNLFNKNRQDAFR